VKIREIIINKDFHTPQFVKIRVSHTQLRQLAGFVGD